LTTNVNGFSGGSKMRNGSNILNNGIKIIFQVIAHIITSVAFSRTRFENS